MEQVSIKFGSFYTKKLAFTTSTYRTIYPGFSTVFIYSIWLLLIPTVTFATHIVGGQLEMVMIDQTIGHFQIKMTYYYNEAQTANLPLASSDVFIFRKSDGKQMAQFTLTNSTLSNRPPVVFANPNCALSNNLRMSEVLYLANIQLNADDYSDPQGYYMTQQNCCRNANIANINNPQTTPFLFYLEFPALRQAGQAFTNSSPVFTPLIGDYICAGSPFTFPTVAIDPDGDELRYSLVSPLAGTFILNPSMAVIKPAPYPEVNWRTGFGPQQAIPGNPPLTIDARTGILSVKASQTGLYVFSIRVEEFRRGAKIGEIRRDLQLLVLDCPTANLPIPTILIQNRPSGATTVNLCQGNTVQLQTTDNPAWNYQWSENTIPLKGAVSATLAVSEPGDYVVTISLASGCSQRVSSEKVRVTEPSEVMRLAHNGPASICKSGGTVQLTAPPGYGYRWFRDGTELSNQTAATLAATQLGNYTALLADTDQRCYVHTDTITITQRPDPVVVITPALATTLICPGDSLLLSAQGASSYQWSLDGVVIGRANQASFYAKTPGTITATGRDTAGCAATSPPFVLGQLTKPVISFDPIPPVCGTAGSLIRLNANPAGGSFLGKGIVGNQFDPKIAGIGRHELTYTINNPTSSCGSGLARQQVEVAESPGVDLPAELTVYKGGTVNLQPVLTGQPVQFLWQPATQLSSSDQPFVQAVDIQNDIQYSLKVTAGSGCWSIDSVRIRVLQRVWIPDAFTPNGDGVNDTWQLNGIETYPEARLTIYNRWGEVVYQTVSGYNRPFDGTLDTKLLPAGLYTYSLYPSASYPPVKGWVLLLR